MALIIRAAAFLALLGDAFDDFSRSKSRSENARERDEDLEDGERKGSEGRRVGRSVGRSEVPFCFSAGVWRRDSSGTLSERDVITTPLLLPSQGVPRAPANPGVTSLGPPFPTPPTGHGYNVDQARGCLTGCRVFSLLSFFVHSSISFPLAQALDLHPPWRSREKTREAGGKAVSGAAIRLYNKPKELEFQRETRFCILRATPVPVRAAPIHTAFR